MNARHALSAALLLLASACSSGSGGAVKGNPVAPSPTNVAPLAPTGPSSTITSTTSATSAGGGVTTAARPCTGAAPAGYSHVVWIIMENRGFSEVAGSRSAPYLASLAGRCGLAVDYSGVTHPSLPNYIALTSGSPQGISDDSGPASHPLGVQSIFGLLGGGWRTLAESMPSNCDHHSSGRYAVKHNPAAYYTPIAAACAAQDVPLGATPDLSARLTVIIPNLCNDMHDCSTATGDHWLAGEVPQIVDSPQYRSGTTVLFITWDENDSGGSRVPTYVVAPSVVPGTRAPQKFDHYSLLRTTEDLLGLRPLLGRAATAADMSTAFHL